MTTIQKLEKEIVNISKLDIDEKLKLKLMEAIYDYYNQNEKEQEIRRIRRKVKRNE